MDRMDNPHITPDQASIGVQVIYVPDHVALHCPTLASAIDHPGVEFGFLTGPATSHYESVYVRYWSKHTPHTLRTQANSELTPLRNLYPYMSAHPQRVIDTLKELGYALLD